MAADSLTLPSFLTTMPTNLSSFFTQENLASLSTSTLASITSTLNQILADPRAALDNLKATSYHTNNSNNNASAVTLCASTLVALVVARWVYGRVTGISLREVRGPEGEEGGGWLAGDIPTLFTDTTGMLAARWAEKYGTVVKLRPQVFTKNALLVTDPAALRHVMQSESAERYIRAPEWYAMADLLAGECIGSVEGSVHKRHRKGLRPAFGVPETRALLPVFNGVANKLCQTWETLIDEQEGKAGEGAEVNVAEWIGRAALDAFGEVALDYEFGGLDNEPTELAKAMPTVLLETFGTPTPTQLAALSVLQYVPMRFVRWVLNEAPVGGRLDRVRETNNVSQRILLGLIDDRKTMMKADGKGVGGGGQKKDIMSHILRAGFTEDESARLTDYEIVSELRFLLLAGQETSANTLSWALHELVNAPEIQRALRREVREARERKGGKEFTAGDLQGLPLLNAVIKETLRFCPVIQNMFREATVDDVLPLSEPLTLKSGKTVTSLPIPAGTKLYISVNGYNLLPSVWGPDAQTFNPQRWLDGRLDGEGSNTLGMYANLMTFSAGTKGCIGWRFAVLQLQNLLAELVDRFEFEAPKDGRKVLRANCMSTQPMVEGEYEKGAQLPLVVKRAAA